MQLHNIKLQQALVGLNVRQAAAGGDAAALGGKFRDLRGRKEVNYTQQDAKDIIDRNTADDNAAYMRLAERIIQQQDAAVSSPAAIRASIPEQGRVLTFKRAVVVDTWADLKIHLAATAAKAASWGVRVLILAASLLILAAFAWAARSFRAARAKAGLSRAASRPERQVAGVLKFRRLLDFDRPRLPLKLSRVSSSRYRVRRATLDDIRQLTALWQSMQFPTDDLAKRVTEFQVAEGADGAVLGAVGLQIAERQAWFTARPLVTSPWPNICARCYGIACTPSLPITVCSESGPGTGALLEPLRPAQSRRRSIGKAAGPVARAVLRLADVEVKGRRRDGHVAGQGVRHVHGVGKAAH